jgi:hypothetical protein
MKRILQMADFHNCIIMQARTAECDFDERKTAEYDFAE